MIRKQECRDCQSCRIDLSNDDEEYEVYPQTHVCYYTEKVIPIDIHRYGGFEPDCPLLVNTLL